MRILIVEDDRELAKYVARGLEEENLSVVLAFNGKDGLRAAQSSSFDMIILDIMLPVMDGLEVTRCLRREYIQTPILLLTARDAADEIVRGLDAGADDYLTKPFSFDVLLARIRARTRSSYAPGRLKFAGLTVDMETHEVWRDKAAISLTRTEFSILEALLRASGRVVTRDQLMDSVWGDRDVGANNLEVFITFLRKKVDLPGHRKLIHTERGLGYSLRGNE